MNEIDKKKLNRKELEKLYKLKKEQKLRDARNNFYTYCRIKDHKFYKKNRPYLKTLCDTLQALYEGKLINPKTGKPYRKLAINIPPRHGKTKTLGLFNSWVLGKNNENRIIAVSYNELLSSRFSQQTKDIISEQKLNPEKTIYSEVFSDTKIRYGDSTKKLWSLEAQFFNYLATSPDATVTGIGCNIGVIDDLIKNGLEAQNETILNQHWDWYIQTFLSRLEANAIQIVVMTRWSINDFCGKLSQSQPDQWYVLEFPIYDEKTELMLCEEIKTKEEFFEHKDLAMQTQTSFSIFMANYQQKPFSVTGNLYKNIKTYDKLPYEFDEIIAYIDTADKGEDNLCMHIAGITSEYFESKLIKKAYTLCIYYTDEGMTITQPKTAELLYKYKVNRCLIESNNGGEGFEREVKRLLNETPEYSDHYCATETFHQSKNKEARIKSNAVYVVNNIYYPITWKSDYPKYADEICTFPERGKPTHDDGADCTTGLAEMMQEEVVSFAGWTRR